MAGFDKVDPANPCLVAVRPAYASAGSRMTAEWVSNLVEEMPARELDEGTSGGRRIRLAPANRSGRQGARADVMTGDRETSLTRQAGKDVPQFAPNFTVYVLPPDVVCLYSEDRKFFLHGELYCALASAIGKGRKEPSRARRRAGTEFSARQDRGSPQAADRAPLCRAGIALLRRRRGRLLGEPRPAAGNRRAKSRKLPGARSIDRRAGRGRTRRRAERARRSRRQAFARPDGHAGERLSRAAAGRTEPAARVGQDALAARAALRRFSAGGTGVQPGRQRLLDLPVRPHDPESGGQGISRPRTGARRRRFAARPQHARTKRHPVCRRRNREGDRQRISHRSARSHRQPRPAGLDHREALRGGAPAMSDLRQQEAAEPAPRAGSRSSSAPAPSWS